MRPHRRTHTESFAGEFSEEVKELAERIRKAYGITPLAPGERRPPGYYRVPWFIRVRPLPPPNTRTTEPTGDDDKR
jgi:hypothetical protein